MTNPTFRTLCAELVEAWYGTSDFDFNDFGHAAADIATRARTALAQTEPQGPAPTPDDFRKWWRETGSASPAPTPEMLLTANAWAEHWAARCLRAQPEPPSLKEQALAELAATERCHPADYSTIRKALEALPNE